MVIGAAAEPEHCGGWERSVVVGVAMTRIDAAQEVVAEDISAAEEDAVAGVECWQKQVDPADGLQGSFGSRSRVGVAAVGCDEVGGRVKRCGQGEQDEAVG